MATNRSIAESVLRNAIAAIDQRLASSARFTPSDEGFLVTIEGESAGKSVAYAHRKRREIAAIIRTKGEELGRPCTVRLDLDDAITRLERLFESRLRIDFPSINSVTFEISGQSNLFASINMSEDINDSIKKAIVRNARKFIDGEELHLQDCRFLSSESRTPSDAAILRSIRKTQPTSLHRLTGDLQDQGFTIPNRKWLRHRIDHLRQRGLAIAGKDTPINLSGTAIERMSSFRGRNTGDVERALALARRRW